MSIAQIMTASAMSGILLSLYLSLLVSVYRLLEAENGKVLQQCRIVLHCLIIVMITATDRLPWRKDD